MRHLFESNQPVDVITLERVLQEKNLEKELGGFTYLVELSKNTPSAANIVAYANIIRRDSQARQLFALGNTLKAEVEKINSQEQLDMLIEQTEKCLTDLNFNQSEQDTTVDLADIFSLVLQKMDASCKRNSLVTGVPFCKEPQKLRK